MSRAVARAFRIRPCGDQAVSVELGEGISPEVHTRVVGLRDALEDLRGLVAAVPAYRSLFLQYDPLEISFETLCLEVEESLRRTLGRPPPSAGRRVEVPVCYDPSLAPDLEDVARLRALSAEDVVSLHSASAYLVYLIGFTPGFAFLGGLDPRLHTPRLPEPRKRVPAGSVGIAGAQTGAYAVPSPGGWRLIGRTPLALFDPTRREPALLRPGDRVRFRPVGLEEYLSLGGRP